MDQGNVKTPSVVYNLLPEDFACSECSTVFDAGVWDYAATDCVETIITTVPPRTEDSKDSDVHCQWITRKNGSATEKVFNNPEFPKPVPSPDSGEVHFAVQTTSKMGIGLFATRDIPAGALIFAERPLLVVPVTSTGVEQRITGQRYYGKPKQEDVEFKKTIMEKAEVQIQEALSMMEEDKQRAYLALSGNPHQHGPLFNILRSNGYQIEGLYDGSMNNYILEGYVGVCRLGSRINHSCRPNVQPEFDLASFSFLFKAQCDIEAGEQLFYSYVSIYKSVASRQRDLVPYGFSCRCASCVNATLDSDKLRAECNLRIYTAIKLVRMVVQARALDRNLLERLAKLRDELLDEGLDMARNFPPLLKVMQEVCERLKMHRAARDYEEEANKYARALGVDFHVIKLTGR